MQRRSFLQSSLALASSAVLLPFTSLARNAETVPFKLNFAPHEGMFKNLAGNDFIDQISFAYDQGFRSIEDNGLLGRSVADQERIGNTLAKLGMTMGVFVVEGGDNWKVSLATGKTEFKDSFVKTCKACVDAARRVNARWMTVVPGFFDRKQNMGMQTAHIVDALRRGAEIFEPHGLIMVLEPLSDTPELFLRTSDQTYEICKAVKSP
ncbi:MAG TPA: xylose isomerase, partial [Cytophagales bacterium]|nr:xylose isomerase [Cytophagales bacterium]